MKIRELEEKYPLVYKAAYNNFDRVFAYNNMYSGPIYNCPLAEAFDWSPTKQGFDFWDEINEGNFETAEEICPELFKSEEEWIPKIGDWVVMLSNYDSLSKNKVYKVLEPQFKGESEFYILDHKGKESYLAPSIREYRKALPHEIPNSTEDELLAEAKRRYPIGTKYKYSGDEYTVDYVPNVINNIYSDGFISIEAGIGYIYYKGKWAEIVNEVEYKGKVVHVDTQDKWDFVNEKSACNLSGDYWNYYKDKSCIDFNHGVYSPLDFYKKNNYKVISFDEYLSLNLLHEEWESHLQQQFVDEEVNKKEDLNLKKAPVLRALANQGKLMKYFDDVYEFNKHVGNLPNSEWQKLEGIISDDKANKLLHINEFDTEFEWNVVYKPKQTLTGNEWFLQSFGGKEPDKKTELPNTVTISYSGKKKKKKNKLITSKF